MSNINARLVRAIDGAAPQYKVKGQNKFETAEGSNGAQHMKIVDNEGNMQEEIPVKVTNQIEMPTDYPDANTAQKLTDLENKITALTDTLNGVIEDGRLQSDTRLTGSIVEVMDVLYSTSTTNEAITITPGSSFTLMEKESLKYNKLTASIGLNTNTSNCALSITHISENGLGVTTEVELFKNERYPKHTFENLTNKYRLQLRNEGTADIIISRYIVVGGK